MSKYPLTFIVIGSGWRSLFYWRTAQAYPNQFEMKAMLCRIAEKAERMRREYGICATTSAEACEKLQPDFVVVAVDKASIAGVTMEWVQKGFPVLCETPAAMTLEDLHQLWQLHMEGAKLQVAEQYFRYPLFAAGIEAVQRGYLGDPYTIEISAVHEYHAASLIRRYLGIGLEPVTVSGKKYIYPVEETDSRYGAVTDGTVKNRERVRMTFEFDASGKAAFYDFDGVQYHSFIRGRHLSAKGRTGELDDEKIRYVDGDHVPHELRMEAQKSEDGRGYIHVRMHEVQAGQGMPVVSGLREDLLYENPFVKLGEAAVLPQDETAIGTLMLGMRDYLEHGTEIYPLAEALQDAYIRILMEEALTKGIPVTSQPQPWSES